MSNNIEEKIYPKYFTELHGEVLALLGEEKCLQLSKILGNKSDTFSFQPIACFVKRREIVDLLMGEEHYSVHHISIKTNVAEMTVRRLQRAIKTRPIARNIVMRKTA